MSSDDRQNDWIDTATRLAGMIGMNPVRVRWKLRRWQDEMTRRREQTAAAVKHKLAALGGGPRSSISDLRWWLAAAVMKR